MHIILKKQTLVVIAAHLLPLTNYLANGQYALVQPIDSKFAERCICTTLTPSCLARLRTTENAWERLGMPVFFQRVPLSRSLVVSWSRSLAGALPSLSQAFSGILSQSRAAQSIARRSI